MNEHSPDEAVAHAKAQVQRRGSTLWLTLALAVVVAAGAFFAGRSTGPAVHTQAATTAPAKSLWTCSMHPQVIQDSPGSCPICHMELVPLASDGGHADGAISIDPVVVQNMGVRVARVAKGPVVQSVRAVGYLQEPEPLHRDINLRVNGWIEKLYANVDGMPIEKGQPLFDLYSPELMVAADELIAARKQSERSPNDPTTLTLLDSSKRKLTQFGLQPEQLDALAKLDSAPSTIPVLAPLSGHLTAKMVNEGAAVKSGDLVMRVASRHEMWVDAQVPEAQMSLISDGQPARAIVVSQPGKVFSGKVMFTHPHLDPQTRTALVRVQLDNHDLLLREGMYATVEILADAYREAPLVPREAVLDTGKRQVVFVSLGDGKFSPRDVSLGLSGENGLVEVTAGLNEGDTVVTSGQFLLDSESRLKDAVAKQLAGGLSEPPKVVAALTTVPAVTKVDVPHGDPLMRAYLALSDALGARQASDEPIDFKPLLDTASMAAMHASPEAKPLVQRVVDAASAMKGKSIDDQRAAFVGVSDAMVDLARRAKLTHDASSTLFVLHCPMAFHEKGANWLQSTDNVANPYYATQMKKCGEVVERIELP